MNKNKIMLAGAGLSALGYWQAAGAPRHSTAHA